MTHMKFVLVLVLLLTHVPVAAAQPTAPSEPRTATQVIVDMISGTEKQLISVAREMPENKYDFAPTEGAFRGVRNFAKQIKHAVVN
jgi:hypothetical protein